MRDVAAVSWEPDRIDLFWVDADRVLWHRAYAGGWTEPESLGGRLASPPAVTAWAPDQMEVFAVFDDGASGTATGTAMRGIRGSRWRVARDWRGAGGELVGADRLDVFATGVDGSTWHRWWDGRGGSTGSGSRADCAPRSAGSGSSGSRRHRRPRRSRLLDGPPAVRAASSAPATATWPPSRATRAVRRRPARAIQAVIAPTVRRSSERSVSGARQRPGAGGAPGSGRPASAGRRARPRGRRAGRGPGSRPARGRSARPGSRQPRPPPRAGSC
jgi:hypothetical protein